MNFSVAIFIFSRFQTIIRFVQSWGGLIIRNWYFSCMLSGFTPTPTLPASAPAPGDLGVLPATSLANVVPTARQTHSGVIAVPFTDRHQQDYPRRPLSIMSQRLAPSTISSERALEARSLMMPEFSHNVAATRALRISNLYADTPRFRNQLDILA